MPYKASHRFAHIAPKKVVPVMDLIRDDFHRVKRKRGLSPDSFTYFADNDETGHADIFTAKALCDVVAQELKEYGGIIDGMRIAPEAEAPVHMFSRNRPDHSDDDNPVRNEWHGIGDEGGAVL